MALRLGEGPTRSDSMTRQRREVALTLCQGPTRSDSMTRQRREVALTLCQGLRRTSSTGSAETKPLYPQDCCIYYWKQVVRLHHRSRSAGPVLISPSWFSHRSHRENHAGQLCMLAKAPHNDAAARRGRPTSAWSLETVREPGRRANITGAEPEQSRERLVASSDRAKLGGAGADGRKRRMELYVGIDVAKRSAANRAVQRRAMELP